MDLHAGSSSLPISKNEWLRSIPTSVQTIWDKYCKCWKPVTTHKPPSIRAQVNASQGTVVIRNQYLGNVEFLNDGQEVDPEQRFFIGMASEPMWLEKPDGGATHFAANEVMVLDSRSCSLISPKTNVESICMVVDGPRFLDYVSIGREISGTPLGWSAEMNYVARNILRSVWLSSRAGDRAVSDSLARSMLMLMSNLDPAMRDSRPRELANAVDARREQIATCIRRHFGSPDFNIRKMADMMNVSSRYLQQVCSQDSESPGEQLRRHRLQIAGERLQSATWARASIAEISQSCGFGSSSHFSAEFRRHHGMSPSEYRHENM